MEQTVWLIIGVISIILSFGIIAKLVAISQGDMKVQAFRQGIDTIKSQCEFVCNSPKDTLLSINAELPSGMVLTAGKSDSKKICGILGEEIKCVLCSCGIEQYTLDLNTSLAKKAFNTHQYSCYFERAENGVKMECKG